MSVAVDFGAPRAPRPAWFPDAARLLADVPASRVLAWAVATFGSDLSVACSMQDTVLVDLAVRADPDVEVVFLDTGFHFAETLDTARRVQARYRLNLVTLRSDGDAATYLTDGTTACCEARKVAPLERHLAERGAWVTGLRRAESTSRAGAATLEWDADRGVVEDQPHRHLERRRRRPLHRRARHHRESLAGKGFRIHRLRALHPAGRRAQWPVGRQRPARVRAAPRQPEGVSPVAFSFPIALEVTGRRCAVFGSGPVARARVAALIEAGRSRDGHRPSLRGR